MTSNTTIIIIKNYKKIMAKTTKPFLENRCIQVDLTKFGPINYNIEAPIHSSFGVDAS